MELSHQGVFVQEQPKVKALFLTKSIPFLSAIGSFFPRVVQRK